METGSIHSNFKVYTRSNFTSIPQVKRLDDELIEDIKIVSLVLPFRVNEYVINELIDWDKAPTDPMFQLIFPNRYMLPDEDYFELKKVFRLDNKAQTQALVVQIQMKLNPHPGDQMSLNVPEYGGAALRGIQHKYEHTVLFFPKEGQYCHSYCSYCFRWAQFIGNQSIQFSSKNVGELADYLKINKKVTDVLLTGGDPLVMRTRVIREYLELLLRPEYSHIKNIRIGTKALTYWPQRFLTDSDADELISLFEKVVGHGKSIDIMAHFSHWKEVETPLGIEAIKRLRNCGATIRSQAPVMAHINDDPDVWVRMWSSQVNNGVIPYYMFMDRDTGSNRYFEIPIVKALQIYQYAIQRVSGLGRTARGPIMSTSPGKVEVLGITNIGKEKYFCLRFVQGRDPEMTYKPLFAKYSDTATWYDQLDVTPLLIDEVTIN